MQAGSDDIQACASCHFNAGLTAARSAKCRTGGRDNRFEMGSGPIIRARHCGAPAQRISRRRLSFRKVANVRTASA
jgi:hypothetical protein